MQFLQKTSIKGKQTLIVMLTCGVALLLACAAFSFYEVMTFRAAMVQNLSILAEIIGNNSSAALDFSDPKAATEALSALQAEPNIEGACIYTSKGEVFAVYDRAKDGKTFLPPVRQANNITFSKDSLVLFRPIVRDNENLGTVYVVSNLNALYARLDRYILIAVGVFLASGLIAFLLSSRLGRLISGPILSLVQTTHAVTVGKNYSVRAVKQSEDELGVLIDGFNEMLKQIQERDAALQKSHLDLEKRVKERTEEVVNSLSLIRATLESTTDGILVADRNGQMTCFNEKFVEMWRISPEVVAMVDTQKMAETVSSQLKDPEQFLSKISELYADAERESFDLLEFKDGRVFERYSKPQRVEEKSVGRVWSFRDITERKNSERQLHVQYAISRILAEASTVEQVAPQILQIICENLGWDVGGLWHLDRREGVLGYAEMWNMPGTDVEEFKTVSKQMTFARGTGLPGRVWGSGQPAWIHDVVLDANFPRSPVAGRASLHGAFGFPIMIENEVGAVIELFSHEPREPDETSLLIVASLGNQIGQFFQRKRSEVELEQIHQQLVDTSRQAGMAEVATSVLHNVGNVLNSVNVSSTLVSTQVRKSKVANLSKIVALLNEHATDIGTFLTSDPKGKQLPGYLGQLAEHLVGEQATVLKELHLLHENIEHIKDIVVMQQSYAKISGIVETVKIADLVEDALRLNLGALQRHGVEVLREFEDIPPIDVEKHKILQILVNLVRNAKYACDESLRTDKKMTLRVTRSDDLVKIAIIDNGIGIPAENLTRIFNHGFTTRKEGHGFGLHSAVLAAMEMGGSLKVDSDGRDQGATFTLELPYTPHENL
jgi:PAS domain S-box-containing protein